MRCCTFNMKNFVLIFYAFYFYAAIDQVAAVNCPGSDKDGTPLTASNDLGTFVTCTYQGSGPCTYFVDGSFSSGSSQCPKGLPQTGDSSTTSSTDNPPEVTTSAPETTVIEPQPTTIPPVVTITTSPTSTPTPTVLPPSDTTSSTTPTPTTFSTVFLPSTTLSSTTSSASPTATNAALPLLNGGFAVRAFLALSGLAVFGMDLI